MASLAPKLSCPLACSKSFLRTSRLPKSPTATRPLSTFSPSQRTIEPLPPRLLGSSSLSSHTRTSPSPIKTYPPPPSARRAFPDPLFEATNSHITVLDPTGSRTRLFARSNPDAPRPGDILLAIFKTGEPFAGVCLSIRRRGTDTAVLLRNRIMMTGVELWVKIYSPNVLGIEVVKRAEKRARRARLFYMRKPKHDRGSVEKVVEQYLKQRRLVRVGGLGGNEAKGSVKGAGSGKR